MDRNRATVRMRFADGSVIDSWTSFTLRDSYTDPLSQLDFECKPPREQIDLYRGLLRKGELVSVSVNGVPQCVGIIQTVRQTIGRDGTAFSLSANTPLVTPYQGGVNPTLSLSRQADVGVLEAILEALAPYGMSAIVGNDRSQVAAISGKPLAGQAKPTPVAALKHRDAQAQDGETAYGFCSRIFTRLGVVLRMAWDGTLLVTSPDYEQAPAYAVAQTFGESAPGDLLLADPPIEIVDTNDGQYSHIIVRGNATDEPGQTQTTRAYAEVSAAEFLASFPAYRSEVQPHKPLYIKDKNARDSERARNRAILEHGARASRAFRITGEVDGFVANSGAIWTIDTTVDVRIDAAGIRDTFWILERTLTQSRDGGQRTRLVMIPRGALVLGEAA